MHSGEQYHIACEPVPFDWISDAVLVQRFNALRQVSLIQFVCFHLVNTLFYAISGMIVIFLSLKLICLFKVYAVIAYALTFTDVWANSSDDISTSNWRNLIQGVGGVSNNYFISMLALDLTF